MKNCTEINDALKKLNSERVILPKLKNTLVSLKTELQKIAPQRAIQDKENKH
jgi:hypothetical protein